MTSTRFPGRASMAAGLLVLLAGTAGAQTYSNPDLPRSPYALPPPAYREPDLGDALEGNGQLHSSGQWRHWGDKRNSGEFIQQLIAPGGVLEVGPRTANGLPASRWCAGHPGSC